MDSLELDRVKGDIEQILPSLGKHRIEELRQVIDRHYAKRFKGKRRTPKYGNLNKGFTDNQLNVFFKAIDNEKYRLLFSYQANLGLRVGEVVKLNIKDINQQTRELTVFTEKAKTVDTLEIRWPSGTVDTLKALAANELYVIQEGGKILKTQPMNGLEKNPDEKVLTKKS